MGTRAALVVCLLATLASSTAAQVDPERARPAKPDSSRQDTTAALPDTVRLQGPELGYAPALLTLAFLAGSPGSGDAQIQPVRAVLTLPGIAQDTAILTRELTVRGTAYAGVAATLSLGGSWGARLAAGIATASVQTSLRGDDEFFSATPDAVPDLTADLRATSAEATVRYWIPSSKRIQPFLEVGGAISRWTMVDGPGAEELTGDVTRWEAVVGLGGVFPLSHRFSAHLRASSRVLQSPFAPRVAGDTLVSTGTLLLTADPPRTDAFADGAREALGMVRLEAGVSFNLRRSETRPEPGDPVEEPGTTTPPEVPPGP